MTEIVKAGWIQRYSKSFLEGGWKNMWVVLHRDSNLMMYKRQGDSDSKGSIFLKDVGKWFAVGQYTNGMPERPDIPSTSKLDLLLAIPMKPSSKAKIFWFLFNDEKELNEWMTSIVSVLPPAPRKSQSGQQQQPPQQQPSAPLPQMPYAGAPAPPGYAQGAPSAPPPYSQQAPPPPYAPNQQRAAYPQQAPYPQQPYPQQAGYPRQPYPQQPYPQQQAGYPRQAYPQQPYYPQQRPIYATSCSGSNLNRQEYYSRREASFGFPQPPPRQPAQYQQPAQYPRPVQYQQRPAYGGQVPPPPHGYASAYGQYPQQPYYQQPANKTVIHVHENRDSGLDGVGELALGMAGGALLAHGAMGMMGGGGYGYGGGYGGGYGVGYGGGCIDSWGGGGWGCGRWGSWSSLSSMSSFGSCGSFSSFGSWD